MIKYSRAYLSCELKTILTSNFLCHKLARLSHDLSWTMPSRYTQQAACAVAAYHREPIETWPKTRPGLVQQLQPAGCR